MDCKKVSGRKMSGLQTWVDFIACNGFLSTFKSTSPLHVKPIGFELHLMHFIFYSRLNCNMLCAAMQQTISHLWFFSNFQKCTCVYCMNNVKSSCNSLFFLSLYHWCSTIQSIGCQLNTFILCVLMRLWRDSFESANGNVLLSSSCVS